MFIVILFSVSIHYIFRPNWPSAKCASCSLKATAALLYLLAWCCVTGMHVLGLSLTSERLSMDLLAKYH
jgi:hypothetical protein